MSATTVDRDGSKGRGRRPVAGRPSTEYRVIWALVLFANVFGLVMILSASSVVSMQSTGSPWSQFLRQGMWFLCGLTAMVFLSRRPYQSLSRWIAPALGLAAAGMFVVLVPGIGVNVNGASRWIDLPAGLRVQPSEFVKLAMILYVADLLARRATHVREWRVSIRPVIVVFLGFAALLMLQPNLGTTIVLAAIVLVMLLVGGVALRPLAVIGAVLAAGATWFALREGYRSRRITAFLDPWADPLNTGHQTIQSQVAFANGGVFGAGIGRGRAQWGFLPEAHTDFIYSIIGEEMGLVGSLAVIVLVVAIAVLGVRVAMRAPDRFGMLLATGITTWIVVQSFINIGACVGALPITGVPLPFISAGGSSLVFTMAAAGILASIARRPAR